MLDTLHFGAKFDGNTYRSTELPLCVGEKKLLQILERQLGLEGYPSNTDYLRIELFRQALQEHLLNEPTAFFAKSFEADRFATASALLDWRDELLLAGWQASSGAPPRLHTLAGVESIFQLKLSEPRPSIEAQGFADRFEQVLKVLPRRNFSFKKIIFHEPLPLQTPHIQRLVKIFLEKNIQIETAKTTPTINSETNLAHLQQRLMGSCFERKMAKPDASIIIIRAKRDADAAIFLAQTLKNNPNWQPTFLVPELSLTLEQALIREGFPAMGIPSASLARPSLQALKLAPVFLWEPVDIFKIMEFASLPVKPLEDGLASKVAEALAAKPGLFNDTWFATIFGYLDDENSPSDARKNYEFWFDRRRYSIDSTAPKRDIVGIYHHLHEWALDYFDKNSVKIPSLLVLAEQARRVRDVLQTIPENRLTFLELERIVRTIYEPAPIKFQSAEKNHFQFVHHPGAFVAQTNALIWWNCIHNEPAPLNPRWQKEELHWLKNQGITLNSTKQSNQLRLLLRNRAILACQQQLVLVVPENVDGQAVEPHLLLGDIEAAFNNFEILNYNIDSASERLALSQFLKVPKTAQISTATTQVAPPLLHIEEPEKLPDNEYETLTQLDNLFYYPHQWFFRKQLRLFPSYILSVASDRTMLGNLAHRFFEFLLKEDFINWTKKDVEMWLEEKAKTLLEREGATLLMYGREPEKHRFLNRLKIAAWTLISILKKNGWHVLATEMNLEGTFCGVPVRGKADLVLQREEERAILDLKWGGFNTRKDLIKNGADLQLVFYSKLLPPENRWAHTGYFILENAQLIARNTLAFSEANIPGTGENHITANELIFNKMEKTFRWRMQQIRSGKLEIRATHNLLQLEELYAEILLDLLELPATSSKFDDYRTLIEQ